MVVGEGNKGAYRREYKYVVYGYKYKIDLYGYRVSKTGMFVINPEFEQIISGKLTQWEDYT